MKSIPADAYGEQPTCLCGLGADGMGSCTWAPVVYENDGTLTVVSWGDPRVGQYEVCLDCGLVVAQLNEHAPVATVADALTWSDAARAVVFGQDRELHAWPVIGYVTAWNVCQSFDAEGAQDNAQGYTAPSHFGRY